MTLANNCASSKYPFSFVNYTFRNYWSCFKNYVVIIRGVAISIHGFYMYFTCISSISDCHLDFGLVNITLLIFSFKIFFNPFHATDLFWYPLKTSENVWFSDVFKGYQKGSVAWNGLSSIYVWSDFQLNYRMNCHIIAVHVANTSLSI